MSSTEAWFDANVILRYLLNDDPEQSLRAKTLIEAAEQGREELKVLPHILCEVVYILERNDYGKSDICSALRDLALINNVRFQEEEAVLAALVAYRDKNVDFSDALLAAMVRRREEKVWTFNKKHFARMDVSWAEP